MYLEKNLEKKWLIKSENKILGPYNFDQIIDLIRKKQLSLIDEIRDPETRWLYVRENTEFKGIVEEMRKEIDARQESTKTYQSVSKTVDESVMLKTRTDVNQFTDISLDGPESEPVKDIDVVKEILNNAMDYQAPRSNEKARVYGVKTDTAVQKKLNVFSSRIIVGTVVMLVLAVGGFLGYTFVQKRNLQKQEEELALQVKKYKYLGLYQKSADAFTRLPAPARRKVLPDLLEMYPLLRRLDLVSREDLNTLRDDPAMSRTQKANLELLNFLQGMEEQKYEQAQEALVRATTLDPAAKLIKENEALLYLRRSQFLNAYTQFRTIFQQEKSGRYLMGMTLAYQGLPATDKPQFGRELLGYLDKYTSVYYDFKKELLLSQIVLAHESANDVLFKVSIRQFLNTPCLLSGQFMRPPLLVPDSYQWRDLTETKNAVQRLLAGDELLLFQLHDYLESSQRSAATEFVTNNVPRVASPQNREQMNLLLFDSQGRNKEAVTLEKSPNLDMTSELNQLLLGQNKLELDAGSDISPQLRFLESKQQIFYRDWLELDQLIRRNAQGEIRTYLKDHFITTENFNPVFEAKALVN